MFTITRGSMGSWLDPDGYPSHTYEVHDIGQTMNLDYALTQDYVPESIKSDIKALIAKWREKNPTIDSAWEKAVYTHMNHCYYTDEARSGAVTYGKFFDNADLEKDHSPELHYAVIFIRRFYPDYQPNVSLMNRE